MSNQSIINPDNSKSYLKGAIDVTKLKANTDPSLVQTSFVGQVNKYDRNFVMAANDPMGPKTREQNRLINQPTSSAFINAGIQAASEIGLGTLEGAGFLLDIPQWVNTIKGTERDFGNWFSDSIGELKKEVAEDNPIYAAEGYYPTNAKWWASMIPSIATSASLMIPSMAGAKIVSSLGKLSSKLAKGIANNSKSANLLAKGLEKTGAGLQNYTGVSAAVFSRMAEGTLEATEAGTQAYQKYIEQGMSMEEATEKAGQASAATFLGNMPLLALDLLQYNTIFKQFGSKLGIQAAENALELSTKSLARRTLQKTWNTLKVPIGESAEEGLQFGVKEESIKMSEDGMPDNRVDILMKQYSDIAKNVLPEYFNNDEFLTSITLGAVGGKVFDTITPVVRRLAKMDNTVDEDLRSGKIVAPYYKTRRAFVDLLQQDEVKASEMLEAAKTDPKLKLGEAASFQTLLDVYNDLKVDPRIINNTNSDLMLRESLNESIYSDLAVQLRAKTITKPEGVDDIDLQIDALTQLESYEMQTPSKNLRNIQEIRKRKADYIAKKLETELSTGIKTTYKPKEGYSFGSRTHRAAINHFANIELADIMSSISNSKIIAYESENGSMYGDMDRKIQERLEKIEELTSLRGSEEYDTDEKYINFLLEVQGDRKDLDDEINLILDDLYKENIYDETHPINVLANSKVRVDDKNTNQLFPIYKANKASALSTKDDPNKLRFRNLFSNGISVNQLVTEDKLKYNITPTTGTLVSFDKKEYLLYKIEDTKGFFMSLEESDTFEIELSNIKPTDILGTFRKVNDVETNKPLIILPDRAIVVGEGTTVYARNNIEGIIKHDMLAELSNLEVYKIESNRRKELEKADIKIPALKLLGSVINITPFTLGNKNKASRKEAARKLNLKERELVKLSYYEEGSTTLHSIPFMLVKGELLDISNNFYDPEFDKRVFVKAQKYESQIDINNKIYSEINDKYNNKYLELMDDGTLTVNQVTELLRDKNIKSKLRNSIKELAELKFRIRSPEDIAKILDIISNKGIDIRKRNQPSKVDGSIIPNGNYEIDGKLYRSTTSLREDISNNKFPKSEPNIKYIKPGNTIDDLSRDIFRTPELNRGDLAKRYKPLFSDETVLNDAINAIAKRKALLVAEGFSFISEGIILFSEQTKQNIAGETDLIAYDKLGNIHIMDVKTFDAKTYTDYKSNKKSIETLTKKDGYRIQLSAYADMFEDRTGYKVSGISVLPYVLVRTDDGIISAIEAKPRDNMKVISNIHPIQYRGTKEEPILYNSAFEVLEVTKKTEGIITPGNINRIFKAKIQHFNKEVLLSSVDRRFTVTDFVAYYKDIIEFYNDNKSLLKEIKESDIEKMAKLYSNIETARALEGVSDTVITGKQITNSIKESINSEVDYTFLPKIDKGFFTIVDNKMYYLNNNYLRYKTDTDVDYKNDLYVIKSGDSYYKGNKDFYKKLDDTYSNLINDNVSAEELIVAQELGFEKIKDDELILSEMYGLYSIKELEGNSLRLIKIDIEAPKEAAENNMTVEELTIVKALDDNIKELTLKIIQEELAKIEKSISDLESIDGASLSVEKLKAYIIDGDEAKLLDNAKKLKEFYENKLTYYIGQKKFYEELFNEGDESISKEDIVQQITNVNREIGILEMLIKGLLELIENVVNLITNTERLNRNKVTLREKQNIKSYLENLIPLLTDATEQPAITETDIQELKDLGFVKRGDSNITNLKTKGKFRKLKNKYIGEIVYVSPGIDIDNFVKDVNSEDVIYLNSKDYTIEDIKRILSSDRKDKIIIISNANIADYATKFILVSDPSEDLGNKLAYGVESKTIRNKLLNENQIDFVRNVEFISYGDSLTDFMTQGINFLTDEEIEEADKKYLFQYSGLVDSDVTYNPYKESTQTVRGDYYNAESVNEAEYGSFYPKIMVSENADELNNITDNLMRLGIKTLDGNDVISNYNRNQFENLYKQKSKNDLFKKSVAILVHKSDKTLSIVLAYKDTSGDIVQYIPVGLMNTLEQSLYAYTTEDDVKKPQAIKNIMMSNFIRNEIELIAGNMDLKENKLFEIDYNRIKFTGARTTGLNVEQTSAPVFNRVNKESTVYIINTVDSVTEYITEKNISSNELDILKSYVEPGVKQRFQVLYKNFDKLGKVVILPATLNKYSEAPKEYKLKLKEKIDNLIALRTDNPKKIDDVYVNEDRLKPLIVEILNNYTYFKYNNITNFVDRFNTYEEFISKYNINEQNMVINFERLKNDRNYRDELMKDYLKTNIGKDPYGNIQYIFGTTPDKLSTKDFYEVIEDEPLIAEGLFYENKDKVYTNRFLRLDDDLKKSIKKPLNYETYYRDTLNETPQFVEELTNKFKDEAGVTYIESFNEFVRSLNSIDELDAYNVINHIITYTKNAKLLELRKKYTSNSDFIKDALFSTTEDFTVLYNIIIAIKAEVNSKNKLIREFYDKVDNAFFLDNEPNLDTVELNKASTALLSLAIQRKKLDFSDPNKLISIIKGSTESNFFLNELVLLLLEKTNTANLTTVVKLIKSLRPDIQTIEFTKDNEFVLVKNTNVNPESGKLYSAILKGLKTYGYNVDIESESYTHEDSEDITVVEEEKDSKESWSIVKTFQFPSTTLNKNTKILLQSIISDTKDDLGLNINLNYKLGKAYAMTVDKLVNSKNVEDLKDKMLLYSNSIKYIKKLREYIEDSENPDELYGQLYVSIGNKIRVTYKTVIKDKKGSIYPVLSNRQSAENIISTMLNAGIKSNTKYTKKDIVNVLMLSNKERIELDTIDEFNTRIDELLIRYNDNVVSYNALTDTQYYDKYNSYKSTFTFDTRDTSLSGSKYRQTAKELIRDLVKYIPKSSNAVHMTVEKTMQYQDTTGNFIGYVQNNTKEHFDKLRTDPLFRDLPVLNRNANFEVIQVIGYDDQANEKGTTIGKLNKKLAAEMLLSMHKENSYPVPVPGDSGNMVYVNNVVPTNIDINKELYELMLFEKNRIANIGDRNRGVKSYSDNGKNYVIFKEVNDILKEKNLEFNENNVKIAFDEHFKKSTESFISYLKELDILNPDGFLKSKIQGYSKTFKKLDVNASSKQRSDYNTKRKTDSINHVRTEITKFLKAFTASYVNITLVTINDPSYYPRIEEVFKRAKQNISPGIDMDMNASYTNPNNTNDKVILTLDTEMKVSVLNDVDAFFKEDPQYKEIEEALKSIKRESVLNQFDDTSETDGQAYIDPIAYKQRMVGLKEWTHSEQEIMDELMVGGSIVSYNIRNNKVSTDSKFTTIKPFYFYNGSGIKREDSKKFYAEPIQIKDSEMLITPYYGLKKVKNDNGEFIDNPNYNAFYRVILQNKFGYEFNDTNHTVKYNESKRISDLVVFNSAVKVGLPIKSLTEDSSLVIDDEISIYSDIDETRKGYTITLPFRFWKKQNETPKGHFSKESIYGTQLMKLIMADIPDDATFNINGELLTKEQIIDKYDDILVNDVNVSLQELKNKYGNGTTFDVEKFVRVLQEEMADDTINMQKALEFTFDENGNVITNLSLAHPFVTNRVQPKTNAIFKNNVTVRKFVKGFKAANASSYGFEKKPKIVWNLDKHGMESPSLGINHFEIIAPIHDKKIYEFVDKASGVVNMDALRKTYPELLEGLLYRIPTENKYSMFKVKIIGFLPNEDGAIIMPSMVTALSGMDFDIDKMFGFFKSTTLKYEDYINEVYFKSKIKTKNQLINNIKSVHGNNVSSYPKEVQKEYNDIVNKYNIEYDRVLEEGTSSHGVAMLSYNMYNKSLISDNNKLDIMRAVLSHPTTLKSQIIPGGFKVIEDAVLKMRFYDLLDEDLKGPVTLEQFIAKTDSEKKSVLNGSARTFINPSLWIDTVVAMNVGKDMTGICANHNAARAIIQQSGIKLLNKLITKHAGKLKNPIADLLSIYDFNGIDTILRAISTILSAVVDNGKNPLISYFGLNPDNANIAMAALHLGYPLEDVMYFNKAFTNMLKYSTLTPEQKKSIEKEIEKGDNVIIDIDLTTIEEYIKNHKNIQTNTNKVSKELIEIEKTIYRNYIILKQLGKEFNDIVTYIQRGNRGAKPTYFENYIDIVKYNEYIKNPEATYFDIPSIQNHFNNDKKFTTKFNTFVNEQNDIVNKLLSLPDFFNSDSNEQTSFKQLVESKLYIKKADDKILSKLYNALYYKATVESQSNFFDYMGTQLDYLDKEKFLELKKKYANNLFINSLQIDDKYEDGLKLQILTVDFKDKNQQDEITQEWRNLLQSNNKETRFVGELLVAYSLLTTGFDTSRDSFNHLIPVEFYTDVLENYSNSLNNKIVELVNNPATGVNILKMILSKYNFSIGTFNADNVSIAREDNSKTITILGKSFSTKVSPLYYNVYNDNMLDYNNAVNVDADKVFEEEDINELGSELNPIKETQQQDKKPQINLTRIISGGQSGADIAGLDAALELNIPIGGTASAGFQQETNEGIKIKNTELNTKYGLKEGIITKREGTYGTYDDVYYQRTIDNAQEADGTIWFGNPSSPGGKLTLSSIAQKGKVNPLINPTNAEEIKKWITDNNIKVLNVAGNREKSKPGIYNTTKTMLVEALTPVKQDKKDTTTTNPLAKLQGEQLVAAKKIINNFKNNVEDSLLILGRAGTGKTFMLAATLKSIVDSLPNNTKLNIVGSALANAAKNQLAESLNKEKLNKNGVTVKYHSVASLLNSVKTSFGRESKNKPSKIKNYRENRTILIVDEMSMLSQKDYEKIQEDSNKKVLVIYAGDHGQLPPINSSFDLLSKIKKENILHLTDAKRQKKGSPILDYLDPIWENATKQPNPSKVIDVPNKLTPNGGIATINLDNSINNIAELYKKAIDAENLNYVQYISYKNDDIDSFNKQIRTKIFGDKVADFVEKDFLMFYDNHEVIDVNEKEPLLIDNSTKAIIKKVGSDYKLTLTDLNKKEITFKGKTYTISYKLNNIQYESDVNILNLADKAVFDDFYKAMIFLDSHNGSNFTSDQYKQYKESYLKYKFGKWSSASELEKANYATLVNAKEKVANVKHGYATTVHKSQGMTTDVAIYNYESTKNTLDYVKSKKKTQQEINEAILLEYKTNYTASSRAKHLMLIVEGNGSNINEQGSFVKIVNDIEKGTQDKVELTVSDKKSSTTSEKESKVDVKGTIQKTVFSPLYITKTGSKKENGKYKLKDSKGTIVELTGVFNGISYNKVNKEFTVGSVKYKEADLAKALGYTKLTDELKKKIYTKDKSLNIYLLKKYTPPKKSTKTTPPPSTRKPKDEKPKEVKIDMTKQFELNDAIFIPFDLDSVNVYAIDIKTNEVVAIPISKYTLKPIDVIVETQTEKNKFNIKRVKSNGKIYVINAENELSVYEKSTKAYNEIDKKYFC